MFTRFTRTANFAIIIRVCVMCIAHVFAMMYTPSQTNIMRWCFFAPQKLSYASALYVHHHLQQVLFARLCLPQV